MPYKVLLVDDDRDIVETLENRLKREGYEVVTAFDGDEALEKVKDANPDIILLDLMMPKKNGFEVLQEVRKSFNKKWRPVIIVSASDELEAVKKSYNLEADLYLTKPSTMEKVLRGIETVASLIPLHENS